MQDSSKRFKIEIYDNWEYVYTDVNVVFPYYEISYHARKVYLDKDLKDDELKKVILKSAREICQVNYGGGREDPFIEWLNKRAEIEIQDL